MPGQGLLNAAPPVALAGKPLLEVVRPARPHCLRTARHHRLAERGSGPGGRAVQLGSPVAHLKPDPAGFRDERGTPARQHGMAPLRDGFPRSSGRQLAVGSCRRGHVVPPAAGRGVASGRCINSSQSDCITDVLHVASKWRRRPRSAADTPSAAARRKARSRTGSALLGFVNDDAALLAGLIAARQIGDLPSPTGVRGRERVTRICIVGASGKLGHCMVQHALDRGYEVVGVCREQSVAKLDAFTGRITVIPGATDDREVIRQAVAGCAGSWPCWSPGCPRLLDGDRSGGARRRGTGRGWCSPAAGIVSRDGQDVYSRRLKWKVAVLGGFGKLVRGVDLDDQVEACRRVFASDTRWTVVRQRSRRRQSQGL
jgi:hypothetical protein